MRRPRSATVTLLLTAGVLALPSGVSHAGSWEDCNVDREYTTAFTRWDDHNPYFLVTGGDFETTIDGWNTEGAVALVVDQAPWRVNGRADSSALSLSVGAMARTPRFCVEADEEVIRFFYRSPGVSGARMRVTVEVDGNRGADTIEWIVNGNRAGWRVSPKIEMPNLRFDNGRQYIVIRFTPIGTPASWAIDDVMVDPWKSR